ncbi:MAG TPA: galactokinase [Firmicutes bacterium]|nr:galactokinase [Bacillota bacterium]
MGLQERLATIEQAFRRTFGDGQGLTIGRAPGRVNLIGEHTDYNDGFIFPMAIDFDIVMAARKRSDQMVKIHAVDLGRTVEFSLMTPLTPDAEEGWSNYPKGVLWAMQQEGARLPGLEMAFSGTIPLGSGLSSSAALEVATAIVVQKLTGFQSALPALARLCQRAENDFVGMRCGIMDQFISLMGERGHALFLDCRSLSYEQIPLQLGTYKILICQSGVKHSLVDSEYNSRREQCETGVRILAERYPAVRALRDVTVEMLNNCENRLSLVVYKRCLHVITENERVLKSIQALKAGDLVAFGELINQSHDSLRDFYEVSCEEVDLLVELAREVPGVLGARITGGGFGGCTVNLIRADAVRDFIGYVLSKYKEETGIEARVYLSTAAGGAELIQNGVNNN